MTGLIAIPRYRDKSYALAILPCGHHQVYKRQEWGFTVPCVPCRRFIHPLRYCWLPPS